MQSSVVRLYSKRTLACALTQTSKRSLSWQVPKVLHRLLLNHLPKYAVTSPSCRMDISKSTFGQEAVRLLGDIADSHFVAFDFEFSGIAERNRERGTKQNIRQRYEETRASVQEYQPLQIGLTVVKFDEGNSRYVLEPYNLNITPLPLLRERHFTRKWTMSSGAVSFLQRNGFDFGRQLVHGVPYLSYQDEQQARARMTAEAKREDMAVKEDDKLLIDHIRQSVIDWQAQPKEEQEEWLNIPHGSPAGISPDLNAYQRRLVYQTVQNEFPGLKTQGMGHFIQITNPSETQLASQKSLIEEARERDLGRAVGLRWVIDGIAGQDLSKLPHEYLLPALPKTTNAADGEEPVQQFLDNLVSRLKNRRRVLIGHNCLTDVMFLYKMTVGDLPLTLEEFNDKIHNLFPAIIDTKFLASCFSEKHGRLALGEVEQDLSMEPGGPEIFTPGDFDRYMANAFLHEAGYDSWLTARVAIRMAAKLSKEGSARKKDHDRQKQEVAQAAATSPPDFGVQEGYVTAEESQENLVGDNVNNPSAPASQLRGTSSFGHSKSHSINSTFSADSNWSNTSTPTSSVVAVKTRTNGRTQQDTGREESKASELRSAFASASIYDNLNDSAMPGDESPAHVQETEESKQARLERLVKEGKMMPRWTEESGFWEVYGNKLQVNGTVEGVVQIAD